MLNAIQKIQQYRRAIVLNEILDYILSIYLIVTRHKGKIVLCTRGYNFRKDKENLPFAI